MQFNVDFGIGCSQLILILKNFLNSNIMEKFIKRNLNIKVKSNDPKTKRSFPKRAEEGNLKGQTKKRGGVALLTAWFGGVTSSRLCGGM